jgi:hypothetical protein
MIHIYDPDSPSIYYLLQKGQICKTDTIQSINIMFGLDFFLSSASS